MRWIIAVLAVLVLLLQYRIWVSADGAREVLRLDRAVAEQREDNARLEARNQQLAAEVRDLKQGFEAVEERARSDLGLIGPNETYYQVVPPEDQRSGSTSDEPEPEGGSTALAAAAP
jgi:cell division protein FtsB